MKKVLLSLSLLFLVFSLSACTGTEEETIELDDTVKVIEEIDQEAVFDKFFEGYDEIAIEELSEGDSIVVFGETVGSMGLVLAQRVLLSDEDLETMPTLRATMDDSSGTEDGSGSGTREGGLSTMDPDMVANMTDAEREEFKAARRAENPESGMGAGGGRNSEFTASLLKYFGELISLDIEAESLVIKNEDGGSVLIQLSNETKYLIDNR